MGKSPAKWIQTIICGKRDFKPHNAKEKKSEGFVSASTVPKSSHSPVQKALNYEVKDEISATILQAFFRGYLARRAFRAVKSVIRFQALVRGHLVRRQAAATLCSVYQIVKIQALFRGRKARNSVDYSSNYRGSKASVALQIAKLTSNPFIHKVLAQSSSVLHLRLSNDSLDANSALNWLSRWSYSCFWKPNSFKFESYRNGMTEPALKPSVFKATSKTPILKATSQTNQTPKESEFERVKRNLRNVQNLAAKAKIPSKVVEVEKPKILEDDVKKENECFAALSTAELLTILEEDDESKKDLEFADEEYEASPMPIDDQDTLRLRKKMSNDTEKQEQNDNEFFGSPKLPSYMNSTASAKAKLRSQSTPNSNQEGSESSVLSSRRQSPTSTNKQSYKANGKNISSSINGKAEWRKW